jgi:FtsZ-interacting cell division protein YlmF
MDFISGSTYALDGNIKPVSKKVFIFAPNNISLENNEGKKNW